MLNSEYLFNSILLIIYLAMLIQDNWRNFIKGSSAENMDGYFTIKGALGKIV